MTQPDDAKAPVNSFANQFLIAMPGMVDDNFAGTVVYLCDHTTNGAMGLVINRPTDVNLGDVFDKLDLKLEIQPKASEPVYLVGQYKLTVVLFFMNKTGKSTPLITVLL